MNTTANNDAGLNITVISGEITSIDPANDGQIAFAVKPAGGLIPTHMPFDGPASIADNLAVGDQIVAIGTYRTHWFRVDGRTRNRGVFTIAALAPIDQTDTTELTALIERAAALITEAGR